MSETTLPVRPEYPAPPVVTTPPELTMPLRGWWAGIAGSLGGLSALTVYVLVMNWLAHVPGLDFKDGTNAAIAVTMVSALIGYGVYRLLTLHYTIRENRALREHRGAVESWRRGTSERRAAHAAAVEKYTAELAAWRDANA
jgi:hypothetical protein